MNLTTSLPIGSMLDTFWGDPAADNNSITIKSLALGPAVPPGCVWLIKIILLLIGIITELLFPENK